VHTRAGLAAQGDGWYRPPRSVPQHVNVTMCCLSTTCTVTLMPGPHPSATCSCRSPAPSHNCDSLAVITLLALLTPRPSRPARRQAVAPDVGARRL
jgi:hypothetical protein